jgi:serine phosphatase RsbU (regulator of sigma subunit)
VDPVSGVIRYINAGHEPPLILRNNGELEALEPTGLPIAMVEELAPVQAETRIEPGELLLVLSDGVPEATRSGDDFLGLDPIKAILLESGKEPLHEVRAKIVSAVEDFLKPDPPSDDVTMLLLRRCATG